MPCGAVKGGPVSYTHLDVYKRQREDNHMKIINIGILAHVDAGKTTLTESLLYASGAISELGSVGKGRN